jgi:hypothetical protein
MFLCSLYTAIYYPVTLSIFLMHQVNAEHTKSSGSTASEFTMTTLFLPSIEFVLHYNLIDTIFL